MNEHGRSAQVADSCSRAQRRVLVRSNPGTSSCEAWAVGVGEVTSTLGWPLGG